MELSAQATQRKARRQFSAIAISYFMGLFNDNFYKEAALIIAVLQNNMAIQSVAAAVFTVCYMLGAAPGGWLADRHAKGLIIISAKAVEMLAMIVGALGIWLGNWTLVLAMIGLMGAQSAIFGPAMNGSIPELFPGKTVQTANTVVRIMSSAAIFIGMALAGYLMDMHQTVWGNMPRGIFLVGLLVLIAAAIGFLVAFAAPRIAPHPIKEHFPWDGPIASIRELQRIGKDPLLTVLVCGNVFIWAIAAVMTLLMVNLGIRQFGISTSLTAGMKIVFLIGIAGGGLLSNLIARGQDRFLRVFIPCYGTMAALLILIGLSPYILPLGIVAWTVMLLIALAGVAGGVILIPLESFIQIRPAAHQKGRVIAAANFAVFSAMTLGAGALYALNRWFRPTTSLGLLGLATAGYAVWLSVRLNQARKAEHA